MRHTVSRQQLKALRKRMFSRQAYEMKDTTLDGGWIGWMHSLCRHTIHQATLWPTHTSNGLLAAREASHFNRPQTTTAKIRGAKHMLLMHLMCSTYLVNMWDDVCCSTEPKTLRS